MDYREIMFEMESPVEGLVQYFSRGIMVVCSHMPMQKQGVKF